VKTIQTVDLSGAFLTLLEGKSLPAVEALDKVDMDGAT
jgi:3-phosphoglycerate kinase